VGFTETSRTDRKAAATTMPPVQPAASATAQTRSSVRIRKKQESAAIAAAKASSEEQHRRQRLHYPMFAPHGGCRAQASARADGGSSDAINRKMPARCLMVARLIPVASEDGAKRERLRPNLSGRNTLQLSSHGDTTRPFASARSAALPEAFEAASAASAAAAAPATRQSDADEDEGDASEQKLPPSVPATMSVASWTFSTSSSSTSSSTTSTSTSTTTSNHHVCHNVGSMIFGRGALSGIADDMIPREVVKLYFPKAGENSSSNPSVCVKLLVDSLNGSQTAQASRRRRHARSTFAAIGAFFPRGKSDGNSAAFDAGAEEYDDDDDDDYEDAEEADCACKVFVNGQLWEAGATLGRNLHHGDTISFVEEHRYKYRVEVTRSTLPGGNRAESNVAGNNSVQSAASLHSASTTTASQVFSDSDATVSTFNGNGNSNSNGGGSAADGVGVCVCSSSSSSSNSNSNNHTGGSAIPRTSSNRRKQPPRSSGKRKAPSPSISEFSSSEDLTSSRASSDTETPDAAESAAVAAPTNVPTASTKGLTKHQAKAMLLKQAAAAAAAKQQGLKPPGNQSVVLNSSTIQKLAESVQCSVCLEIQFNSTTLVPCGHSFCEKCTTRLEDCPNCRQPIVGKVHDRRSENIISMLTETPGILDAEDVKHYQSRTKELARSRARMSKRRKKNQTRTRNQPAAAAGRVHGFQYTFDEDDGNMNPLHELTQMMLAASAPVQPIGFTSVGPPGPAIDLSQAMSPASSLIQGMSSAGSFFSSSRTSRPSTTRISVMGGSFGERRTTRSNTANYTNFGAHMPPPPFLQVDPPHQSGGSVEDAISIDD